MTKEDMKLHKLIKKVVKKEVCFMCKQLRRVWTTGRNPHGDKPRNFCSKACHKNYAFGLDLV